jgi:hypothetical protein
MLEPRDAPNNISRRDLRFLGGTENFDLWIREANSVLETHEYPLRIHRVGGGSINWDVFKVPLHMNEEINASMPPADRRIIGHWDDVTLSAEDVQIIEAYLRCFAPGVLGQQTNEEEK